VTQVEVRIDLPYAMRLPDGEYGALRIVRSSGGSATICSLIFEADEAWPTERMMVMQRERAEELMAVANRLIRWYRYLSREPSAVELTLSDVSPVTFRSFTTRRPWGPDPSGHYYVEAASVAGLPPRPPDEICGEVLAGIASAIDPPVWHLLVLDAEVALIEARYREAVLLSWSAIESCFSTTYEDLVDTLTDLSADERSSLKGRDTSLVTKMTAGLKLASGHSLHELLGTTWPQRRSSYRARNNIIHEGGVASKEQAADAIAFARQVIDAMEPFAEPA